MKLGLKAEQEKTLIKLLGFRVGLEDLIIEYGLLKISQQKYAEARILFTKSTQTNPQSFIAFLNLGIACMHIQQFDNARKALSSANILDPSNQSVWLYLSQISLLTSHAGQSPDLQACLREALKLEIEDEHLIVDLAEQLYNQKYYRECKFVSNRIEKHFKSHGGNEELKEKIQHLIASANKHLEDQEFLPHD